VALADCSLCDNLGVCMSGVCLEGAQGEDTACDDGDACTQLDLCGLGACVGSDPVVCPALDQCHIAGQCDPATGFCNDPNADDGTLCDDADVCTQGDSCQGGVCVSAGPVADGTVCDDDDLCTQQDTCQAGFCTGSDPINCTVLDQCHLAGSCDPQTGICSDPEAEDGTACDDGIGGDCIQSDACQAGVCVGGDAVADGTACDDGDLCSQSDSCQAGACTGADPVVCEALDQCHLAGTCDPDTGQCSDHAKPDGAACDDDDPCTQTDSCRAGTCVGADPVDCPASDACHDDGACDPVTGECTDPVAKPDGTECPDGTCLNGECIPEEKSPITACGCGTGRNLPAIPGLVPLLLMLALIARRAIA
jgi:hypothetical protein